MISEIVKHRTNEGMTRGLSFYRDKNGAEVDLVIERTEDIGLMEVKASATPSPRLFDSTRRVRGHLRDQSRPCRSTVVYGGDDFQQHTAGQLVPWRLLRAASLPDATGSIRVTANGQPATDVRILALFPNKTWKKAVTSKNGEATLELHSLHLPMTVYAAAGGFAATLYREWLPAETALHIEMTPFAACSETWSRFWTRSAGLVCTPETSPSTEACNHPWNSIWVKNCNSPMPRVSTCGFASWT